MLPDNGVIEVASLRGDVCNEYHKKVKKLHKATSLTMLSAVSM